MMIVRDTSIQRALKSRQRGWVLNPFRFGVPNLDPYYAAVDLYMPFTTATQYADLSPNPSIQTVYGAPISINTSVADCFGGSGGSVQFDTTTTVRGIATQRTLGFGTGPFTIEYMVRHEIPGADNGAPWSASYTGNMHNRLSGGGSVQFIWLMGTTVNQGSLSGTVPSNVWRHHSYSRGPTGKTRITVDGRVVVVGANSMDNYTSAALQTIGRFSGATSPSSSEYFRGRLNHYRVTRQCRVEGPFIPPTNVDEFLRGPVYQDGDPSIPFSAVGFLLHFGGANGSTTITDSSSYGHTIGNPSPFFYVVNNASLFGGTSGFGTTSANWWADQNAKLTLTANANIKANGSTPWTWECAYRPKQGFNNGNAFFMDTNNNGTSNTGWRIFVTTDGQMVLRDDANNIQWGSDKPLVLDTWHRLAIVFDGTYAYMYQDGVCLRIISNFSNTWGANNNITLFNQNQGDARILGYVDECRWTKGYARMRNKDYVVDASPFPDA